MQKFILNIQTFFLTLTSKKHIETGKILIEKNISCSTAESCTGGLISSRLTDVSGSSEYTGLNFVTYSNKSKTEILGVTQETLDTHGAVSEQCAREMAVGLRKRTGSDICICTTGIAGPTGGSTEKPIGLVYIAVAHKGLTIIKKFLIDPRYNRKNMKFIFSEKALEMAIDALMK